MYPMGTFINPMCPFTSMVEFVTIKESIETHKGNIRGVIIKESDLKAGTGKTGDWTMKVFTLEDTSGQVDITCWNTEIGRLKVGEYYEVESPWWKERNDKPGEWNLALGDYCKVNLVDNPSVQTTTQPTEKQEDVKVLEMPKTLDAFASFIKDEAISLLQIEQGVKDIMKHYDPHPLVDQKVGMFVKEIYRESKKTNFTKAKDISQ